ncbi:MAG: YbjN domain-containing protein [Micrococcales bacterium]|nr:YbjN domain-containing protein [Micrococcales bacterium]
MSYFAKSIGGGSSLSPVSVDRLAQVLEGEGLNFGYSEDRSRLGGYWGEHLVEFIFYGEANEVLQIRAHWGRPLSADRWTDVLEQLNSNNSERIWPKLYVDREGGPTARGVSLSKDDQEEFREFLDKVSADGFGEADVGSRDGDGLAVMAEHAVDYEPGASDEQLAQHVQCAISTSLGAFERLDEAFPQAVAAWRAEHPDWSDE